MIIGHLVQQSSGYKAFVPNKFPPEQKIVLNSKTQYLNSKADFMLGKLVGISHLLPDLDFFIFMYITKEATRSSGIEGTNATIVDVIKSEAELEYRLPQDVDRITHYINAMKYGLARLETLPLSLRFIREIHKELISGTIDEPGKNPGEFRSAQNWIGGGSPNTARFVPPPPAELLRCLDDLENFFYADNLYPPLVKAALIHAQFETIHPFLDGNGRTGRLLIPFYLCKLGLLDRPILYLSEYFLNNRQAYYDAIDQYHGENGDISIWLDFFLDGVAIIADQAISTSNNINTLWQNDFVKIQTMGRRAVNATVVLENLYRIPIVNVRKIVEWTGLTRQSAGELVRQMVDIGILSQSDVHAEYGREFWYKDYLNLFINKEEGEKS
jgi:Fic family protein